MACIVALGLVSGCSQGEQCQDLLKEKCVQCHSVVTNCAKVGESEKRWAEILGSMILLGADISEKERKLLARCLSEPSAEIQAACK